MAKTTDPIFAAYAKSAPLLDLQFYIVRAETDGALPTRAIELLAEMHALSLTLQGPKPGTTAANKRKVWTLIDRFKAAQSARFADDTERTEAEARYWKVNKYRGMIDRLKFRDHRTFNRFDSAAAWAMLDCLHLDPARIPGDASPRTTSATWTLTEAA